MLPVACSVHPSRARHLDVRHAGTNIYLKATAICVKARNIYLKGYGYLRQGYGYLTRHGPAHLDVRTAAVKLLHRTLEREAAQSQARRLGTLGRPKRPHPIPLRPHPIPLLRDSSVARPDRCGASHARLSEHAPIHARVAYYGSERAARLPGVGQPRPCASVTARACECECTRTLAQVSVSE